ncbi:putative ABC transporter [Xylaria longipes]|nr:putative ABC transporter [Xylaria longipes]
MSGLHLASTAAAVVFLLSLPIKLSSLRGAPISSPLGWLGPLKTVFGIFLAIILALNWIQVYISDIPLQRSFLVSLLTSSLASMGLSLLYSRQNYRLCKRSHLSTLYLLAVTLDDGIYLTMPSGTGRFGVLAKASPTILVRFGGHLVLLTLECITDYLYLSLRGRNRNQSPDEMHGLLSRILFSWMIPILRRGYSNILTNRDLPPLSRAMKPYLTRRQILQAWSKRGLPISPQPSVLVRLLGLFKSWAGKDLLLVLIQCLGAHLFTPVLPRLFLILFRYSQPTLIKKSIKYVSAYQSETDGYGYWLILSAVTIYLGLAVSTAIYNHSINQLKLMTKSSLVGLIHDKTMKLSSNHDAGQGTTLMSTDADSLEGIAEMGHETWAQAIEVLIGTILLARGVGWIWPLPLFLIYLCSHMSQFVAKHLPPRQKAWNKATQNRIEATSSILSAMKAVKTEGFQYILMRRIQDLRREELWIASKLRWVIVYNNACANALGIFSPALTLALFAVLFTSHSHTLDTGTAFTTIAILGMITHPANMIMTIVPRVAGAFAGLDRIQTFLLQPSLQDSRRTLPGADAHRPPGPSTYSGSMVSGLAIQVEKLQIGHEPIILQDVNLRVAVGSLTIIAGPTGSGKSVLLRAVLGEVVPVSGVILVSTRRISYCSQRPWLPSGNIQKVICGPNCQFDQTRYNEVISMCCLRHDLDSLPDGDQTQIGSRGLNLSGGQRQRVALARALFAQCDIVLLDDTFSGLDGDTERTIFNNLLGALGFLRRLKTTVILASNSSQYFHLADRIVLLGNHSVIDQGQWPDIKSKAASSINKTLTGSRDKVALSTNFDKLSRQILTTNDNEADLSRNTGDSELYKYYFGFVGVVNMSILVACTAAYGFFITIPQYWLQLWTEAGHGHTGLYTCGFLLISFFSWLSTSIQMWSIVIRLAPQSATGIHQRLLCIVTKAPLTYFSRTENGSILNRFSQDIQLIDKQLPLALQTVVTQIFKLLMQVILLYISQKWLIVSFPVCAFIVYAVQKIYLRSSRQLRFLELHSRAAVFSSFLESVEGLETIRSFGWSQSVIERNIQVVDIAQRPEYLLLCLQRWLNIVLDVLAACVASGVVALAVSLRGTVTGAQIGIALNIMLLANTTLLKLVENWTTLETSLGAISRIKMLEDSTEPEGRDIINLEPTENWPSMGRIDIENISASYHPGPLSLQDISLNIPAGQKLVVCGRTGSGKSTLLLSLLRLLELQSGKIEVDGVNIKGVCLGTLREKCFVTVAQDLFLLSHESLRFNLDPSASAENDVITNALTRTGLLQHFMPSGMSDQETASSLEAHGYGTYSMLDQRMSSFQELSAGQCQLLILCRAIIKVHLLRRHGIRPVILLDEVTSFLDSATERTIYRMIDDEFSSKGHTVIVVAHRLGALEQYMVPGRDAVALVSDGRLVEIIHDVRLSTFKHNIGQNE